MRWAAAFAVFGALRVLALQHAFGLFGPLGPDPALWGLTALDLRAGNAPAAVPLYPWLAGRTHLPVDAGLACSWIAAALLPVTAWWAARPLGVGAVAAGVLTLVLPDLGLFGVQLQPDALYVLVNTALAGALLRRAWGPALTLAVVGWMLREPGAIVLVAALGAALLAGRRRVALAALTGACVWPLALGGTLGAVQPWTERTAMAVDGLSAEEPPPYLPRKLAARYVDMGPLERLAVHAARTAEHSPDGLAWMVLGGLVAVRRRRWLLFVPALPAVATLVVWSERRHVVAFTPVAAIALAGASAPPARIAAAALAVWSMSKTGELGRRLAVEAPGLPDLERTSRWICAQSVDGDRLLSLDQRVGLWCPMAQLESTADPAAWRTWLVAPAGSIAPPWEVVHEDGSPFAVHRLPSDPGCPTAPPGRYLVAWGPRAHPAFDRVPVAGHKPIRMGAPDPGDPCGLMDTAP